ncbi:MAG: hypothetical protein LAO06_12625 [Acidobacteriia bacterium]|nr:hypothetical protein [Terriglobia bacterium]
MIPIVIAIMITVPALLPSFLKLPAFLVGLLAVFTVLALRLVKLLLETADLLLALVVAIGCPHGRGSGRQEEHGQNGGSQNLGQFAKNHTTSLMRFGRNEPAPLGQEPARLDSEARIAQDSN